MVLTIRNRYKTRQMADRQTDKQIKRKFKKFKVTRNSQNRGVGANRGIDMRIRNSIEINVPTAPQSQHGSRMPTRPTQPGTLHCDLD